ncbi:partitioning defective 3 homolog B isoform X3 [Amphiprion ocellaris]|uniref:partitioning defective 3 homolog B isoform X3 n=1 Tax=Amphiprion ocellaris TaxID=80972 RepID=UPI00241110B5|nr:partitioning defective 3 homolog B isoform X3 [Amphiprion ocellaris]
MKVTVTFGQTGVVVPCKDGWTVRDLIQQATQRYRKLLEQEGDFLVRTHHVEYCDGGILDPDDILSDLVEDKDKLMAVYEEQEAQQRGMANSSLAPSPELYQAELSAFQPIAGGEIEVTSSALKSNTPLMVRSSSDSALSPQSTETEASFNEDITVMAASPAAERQAGVDRAQGKHTFSGSLTRMVEILGEDSPLGIHVVPYCSSLSGRALGLYIRGVEEESRSRKEGLFQEDECIVKINNTELMDKTFSQAQDVFRQAMRSPVVRLEVVPSSSRERYEKSLIGQLFGNNTGPNNSPRVTRTKEPPPLIKAKPVFKPSENPATRLAEEAASLEPAVNTPKGRSESPLLKKSPALTSLVTNKRGGRRLRIDLKKGSEGLGFTVVTRDSSVHGPGPILVKNILPRGAAVKDGRLQSGDCILEVNGVDITGVGQEELVCMLRSTRQGESVCLVVLRQEDMFLPREMKDELSRVPGSVVSENGKEQLMFEVPLNDTGSAGLGISLKGNKSRETGEDLGIFIKSIIHGGAAYKDGRLHVNDQLVAVNGESLLGRSNHAAMETLRRSMSQEGNARGTIQLVVLRVLKDQHGVSPSRSFDSSSGLMSPVNGQTRSLSPATDSILPPLVTNSIYASNVTNGSYSHMDEEEDGVLYGHDPEFSNSIQHSCLQERENAHISCPAQPQSPTQNQNQRQFQHVKASKSMDLVEDESNVGSTVGNTAAPSTPVELGPTLGLKKSSSLESLQTAMSEVNRKNELLPFHRPRPNMVRGRGCNESFRAAIDKSYDGPAEDDDDDGSELSSGRDTPASSSSRQGVGDQIEEKSKKDKKKKAKTKKKEKSKGKGKEKEKKKPEEPEETEKKSKKIGFGLLRFGKKKEEKKEAKAALQRQKSDILSDHEFERMKEERERIEAAHPELREQQSRDQQGGGSAYPDFEDDDADPNYARIQSFRDRDTAPVPQPLAQSPPYSTIQHAHGHMPSPQGPSGFPGHGNHSNEAGVLPDDDPLDKLYAKVNKPRGAGTTSPPAPAPGNESSMDRIQQLRREYQQARREGMVPPYEELDPRRRGHENDPHRMPGRGTDHRLSPRYEEVERQYASLPRHANSGHGARRGRSRHPKHDGRGPLDPADYPVQPWSGHYPGPPPAQQGYPQSPSYPNPSAQSGPSYSSYQPGQPYPRPGDPRGVDPGYYPHPNSQQRGPLRQDVPPSPTPPLRGLRYDTMTRGTGGGGYSYRHQLEPSTVWYDYTGDGERQQHQTNPRQKNAMTAAV